MDIIDLRDVIDNRESDPEAYDAWSKALEDAAERAGFKLSSWARVLLMREVRQTSEREEG